MNTSGQSRSQIVKAAEIPALDSGKRRHDLDALRAIAMLLGIFIHAILSFMPYPWAVQDSQQCDALQVVFAAIHGFRMPLFFMLSGFFTAMLWRKRGLRALLLNRSKRILAPLATGMVTIVPLMFAIHGFILLAEHYKQNPNDSWNEIAFGNWALQEESKNLNADDSVGQSKIITHESQDKKLENEHPRNIYRFESAIQQTNYLRQNSMQVSKWKADTLHDSRDVKNANLSEQAAQIVNVLFYVPVFQHLWFLAFLCWLVAGFAVYAYYAERFSFRIPKWLVISPLALFCWVPVTAAMLCFMNQDTFGPDTSLGLLPLPHILLFHAAFFFFGALYFDSDGTGEKLGTRWWILLPVALFGLLPLAMFWMNQPGGMNELQPPSRIGVGVLFNLSQALYAWLMTLGAIGLFHKFFLGKNRVIRYLSDSSYWLYLAHAPLILIGQWLVKDIPVHWFWKFSLITLTTTALLLLSYHYLVRYTLIGTALNGLRVKENQLSSSS